jgi:gamma-glutamyltranspeptidase/glutathione hydrolase
LALGETIASTGSSEIGAVTGVEFLSNGDLEAAAEPVRRGGGDAEVVCLSGQPLPASDHALCAPTPTG